MGYFMYQKTVNMTFFTDHSVQTFFLTGEPLFPLYGLSFRRSLLVANPCKYFLTKTCFSVDITHSSVNFRWFALISHQKFDDRLLFNPGVLWSAALLNRLKTNILWVQNHFCYEPIKNNMKFTFMEKNSEKKGLCFF